MKPTLFPYQLEAVAALHQAHARNQRILLSLPTGSGKTLVAATYAKERFLDRGLRVLWVAHSEELLDQAYDCFLQQGVDASTVLRLYAGKEKPHTNPDARLCFMTNTCRSGPVGDMHLLIMDEAHRSAAPSYTGWMSVYKAYRPDGAKLLGLTATPYRLHQRQHESLLSFSFSRPAVPIFQKMAYRKSFCDLAAIGRVAPFRQVRRDSNLSFDMSEQNGDFSAAALDSLSTPARNTFIVGEWQRHRAKYGKTLIFVGTQAHARTLAEMFGTDGDYAVSGNGVDVRREAIERFRTGRIQVLVNVKILSEGVDVPDVRTVMLARPTMSPNLFMQMVGRGSRITTGKSFFYIVDIHDQLPRYEGLLMGVEELADGDGRLLDVIEKKAEAAETLEGGCLSGLEQDKAVLLEVAAETIESITRRFAGWISFSAATGERKPVGTLLTTEEFAVMASLVADGDRIPPQQVSVLQNGEVSDSLQKCSEAFAQGLWGRLGNFSEVPEGELEALQITATNAMAVSPGRARTMGDFSHELEDAASRWAIPPEVRGDCLEKIVREPSRAAAVIKVDNGGDGSLLILGPKSLAELRKAMDLKRRHALDFSSLIEMQTAIAQAQPELAAHIAAISAQVGKNAHFDDYCLLVPGEKNAQPVSSRAA